MSLIPTKNPPALMAYYIGIFSLLPCFSIILGPVAAILGIIGLKKVKENPELSGTVHAWIGVVLGSLTFFANLFVIFFSVLA